MPEIGKMATNVGEMGVFAVNFGLTLVGINENNTAKNPHNFIEKRSKYNAIRVEGCSFGCDSTLDDPPLAKIAKLKKSPSQHQLPASQQNSKSRWGNSAKKEHFWGES